jgi:hypothetical protein
VMHTRMMTMTLVLFVVSLVAGCGMKNQRVGLTYDTIVGAGGGGGELFIAEPPEKFAADKTPGGLWILGR